MEKLKDTELTNIVKEEIKIKGVGGTPFNLIKQKGKKWRIVVGNSYASNKQFHTKLGAKLYIHFKPYDLIGTLICFINNNLNKI